ncbi:flagellar filament capping protein FliD [candidate division KSB1 bacterium]
MSTIGSAGTYDVQAVVNQLIALEREPLDRLEDQRAAAQSKKSDFSSIDTSLETLQSALADLILDSAFSSRTATSSDSDVVSATTSAGAISGVHHFVVEQLAQSQALMSNQVDTILASSGNTADTDLGLAGDFTINDGTDFATITVLATDSLNQIATKINDAVYDSDGLSDLGVTASIVDYRLSIQRNDSGTTSMTLADTAGTILADMGVFIDHTAMISGVSTEVAGGSAHLTAATGSGGLAYTRTIYTGQVDSFDSVTVASNATTTTGTINLEYSTDDGNSWTDLGNLSADNETVNFASAITGETQIQFRLKLVDAGGGTLPSVDSVTLNFTDQASNSQTLTDDFTATEVNQIQAGRNAYFSVDGLSINREKNSNLTDVLENVTLTLAGTSSTAASGGYNETTLSITTDADTAVSKMNAFVTNFNVTLSTLDLKSKDDEPLENDTMIRYLRRNLTNTVMSAVTNPGRYTHLTEIGISYDHRGGEISLDETAFRNALATNPSDVADLFGFDNDDDGVRDDGGMAFNMDDYLEGYTAASVGVLAKRQETTDVQITNIGRRIERWESRLEKMSDRLFDQYTQLFNALNRLSGQSQQLAMQQSILNSVMSNY